MSSSQPTPSVSCGPAAAAEQSRIRTFTLWRPASLVLSVPVNGVDSEPKISEQRIHKLLLGCSRNPDYNPATDQWDVGEGECVGGDTDSGGRTRLSHVAYMAARPVSVVAWPDADGVVRPFITNGLRKRHPSSEWHTTRRLIETINDRLAMLISLAKEIDADAKLSAPELQLLTKSEAQKRADLCSAFELARNALAENPSDDGLRTELDRTRLDVERSKAEGWEWASSESLPEYSGGRHVDEGVDVVTPGLIVWRCAADGGPYALEYVCRVQFEEEDHAPTQVESLFGALLRNDEQDPILPSVEARLLAELTRSPKDLDPLRRGHEVPVSTVARILGYDRKSIQNKLALLDLEPEILSAMDDHARGEPGLSANQVRDGGFFIAGTGSGDVRVPVPPEEQLQLLAMLRGKRGVSSRVEPRAQIRPARAGGDGTNNRKPARARAQPQTEGNADAAACTAPESPAAAETPTLQAEICRALSEQLAAALMLLSESEAALVAKLIEVQLQEAQAVFAAVGSEEERKADSAPDGRTSRFRQALHDAIDEVLRYDEPGIKESS